MSAKIPIRSKIVSVENSSERTVAILGYTGVEVDLKDYGFPEPLVYNLAGFTVPNHIPYSFEHSELMGHTVKNSNDKEKITHIAKHAVESDLSNRIYNEIQNGDPYEASMDAEFYLDDVVYIENGTIEVNNRVFSAPIFVANKGKVTEITATKGGRDSNTTVTKLSNEYEEGKELLMKIKNSKVKASNSETKTTTTEVETPTVVETPVVEETVTTETPPQETPVVAGNSKPAAPDFSYLFDYIGDSEATALISNARKGGWDQEKFETELKIAKIENSYPGVPGIHIPERGDDGQNEYLGRLALGCGVSIETIETKLGKKVADHADSQGIMGLREGLMLAANSSGGRFNGLSNVDNMCRHIKNSYQAQKLGMRVSNSAFSTIDFPNLMHRVAEYRKEEIWKLEAPQAPGICKQVSSSDFKDQGFIKPRGGKMWEKFNDQNKIVHGSMGKEDTYTTELDTVAQMLVFTRQDVINDDIGIVDDCLTLMLEGALMIPDFQLVDMMYQASNSDVLETGVSIHALAFSEANLETVWNAIKTRVTEKGSAKGTRNVNGSFNTRHTLFFSPGLERTVWEVINQERRLTNANGVAGERNYWFNKFDLLMLDNLNNSSYHADANDNTWGLLPKRPQLSPFYMRTLNNQKQAVTEVVDLPMDMLGFGVRGWWDVNLGWRPVEGGKVKSFAISRS